MNRTHLVSLTIAFSLLLGIAHAADLHREAALKQGALLYDNWPKVTGAQLEGNHPLYPETGKKSGVSTWRCKECHGWDYIGKDGRYAKGSHFTGIKGTLDQTGRPIQEIRAALTEQGGHDFSAYLSTEQLESLAAFLRAGQIPVDQAIDAAGTATGSADAGQPLYVNHCSSCHGADGQALDFKSKKDGIQGVGYLAKENPQESWHKLLWGHPGSDMPSMWVDAGLSVTQAADLLAYTQTLP